MKELKREEVKRIISRTQVINKLYQLISIATATVLSSDYQLLRRVKRLVLNKSKLSCQGEFTRISISGQIHREVINLIDWIVIMQDLHQIESKLID